MKQIADILAKNDTYDWLAMLAITVAVLVIAALAKAALTRFVSLLARRTVGKVDDAIALALRSTNLYVLFPVALFFGSTSLELPVKLSEIIAHVAVVAVLVQIGLWAGRFLVEMIAFQEAAKRAEDPAGATALNLISLGFRAVIWTLVVLACLDRLGINITALVAGLGIGGVAVALAVQNILADLFGSLSIVLDKPFVVGDFIVMGEHMGVVEHVGIKTTRLRSLGGELLVMSNSDLLKSRIRNYKRMQERRIAFSVGVTYETPAEKIRELPARLRQAVEAQSDTRFDRAHFRDFGDSSLNFEVVYYVLSPDYNKFMDVQQAINLAIYDAFNSLGVDFAYPTRTLHVVPSLRPQEPESRGDEAGSS